MLMDGGRGDGKGGGGRGGKEGKENERWENKEGGVEVKKKVIKRGAKE